MGGREGREGKVGNVYGGWGAVRHEQRMVTRREKVGAVVTGRWGWGTRRQAGSGRGERGERDCGGDCPDGRRRGCTGGAEGAVKGEGPWGRVKAGACGR